MGTLDLLLTCVVLASTPVTIELPERQAICRMDGTAAVAGLISHDQGLKLLCVLTDSTGGWAGPDRVRVEALIAGDDGAWRLTSVPFDGLPSGISPALEETLRLGQPASVEGVSLPIGAAVLEESGGDWSLTELPQFYWWPVGWWGLPYEHWTDPSGVECVMYHYYNETLVATCGSKRTVVRSAGAIAVAGVAANEDRSMVFYSAWDPGQRSSLGHVATYDDSVWVIHDLPSVAYSVFKDGAGKIWVLSSDYLARLNPVDWSLSQVVPLGREVDHYALRDVRFARIEDRGSFFLTNTRGRLVEVLNVSGGVATPVASFRLPATRPGYRHFRGWTPGRLRRWIRTWFREPDPGWPGFEVTSIAYGAHTGLCMAIVYDRGPEWNELPDAEREGRVWVECPGIFLKDVDPASD